VLARQRRGGAKTGSDRLDKRDQELRFLDDDLETREGLKQLADSLPSERRRCTVKITGPTAAAAAAAASASGSGCDMSDSVRQQRGNELRARLDSQRSQGPKRVGNPLGTVSRSLLHADLLVCIDKRTTWGV